MVYGATLEVSNTMLLTVTPPVRSMLVLPLPALLNVAVSLTPGTGEALQLAALVHNAFAIPFHVALTPKAFGETTAHAIASPKLKPTHLDNDPAKECFALLMMAPLSELRKPVTSAAPDCSHTGGQPANRIANLQRPESEGNVTSTACVEMKRCAVPRDPDLDRFFQAYFAVHPLLSPGLALCGHACVLAVFRSL
jgi:hypothetical protein